MNIDYILEDVWCFDFDVHELECMKLVMAGPCGRLYYNVYDFLSQHYDFL